MEPTTPSRAEVDYIGALVNRMNNAVRADDGIDPETGIVETPGTKENGEKWIKHPNTHIDILGFKIPEWDALVPFAIKCAEKMPQMSYIGWDFALSKNGWCIMEGNYSGDFMWQVYYGKGMKKEFEDLIGWKLEKDFWWR